ncbi:hypothetical protein L3Q67_38510 [Saccharothrix sp. AJ9571]|nr:hypothetical protein L3Q67_38510 [Saccharothrix sp. AJ9571]
MPIHHREDVPVPLAFQVPDGWQPVSPEGIGSPGTAFVALNLATTGSGFTANITLEEEYRPDQTSLSELADASLRGLAERTSATRLLDRADVGGLEAPGLTQVIGITATVDDMVREVVQAQFYLALPGIDDPRNRVVLLAVLTATEEQFPEVVGDFGAFVGSLKPGATVG